VIFTAKRATLSAFKTPESAIALTSSFLAAFSRLGFQPEEAWMRRLERVLEPDLLKLLNPPPSPSLSRATAGERGGVLLDPLLFSHDSSEGIPLLGNGTALGTVRPVRGSEDGQDLRAVQAAAGVVQALEALAIMELKPSASFLSLACEAIARDGEAVRVLRIIGYGWGIPFL
jgi:hypothetical protein